MPYNKQTAAEAGRKSKRGPAKTTEDLRKRVKNLIDDNYEQIQKDLAVLKPKERVDAWLRLLEYSLPKQARVDVQMGLRDLLELSEEELEQTIIENL